MTIVHTKCALTIDKLLNYRSYLHHYYCHMRNSHYFNAGISNTNLWWADAKPMAQLQSNKLQEQADGLMPYARVR